MAPVPPGEPRVSPKPQPIGNIPTIVLFTTCTLCILFLLWRRANSLRSVVSHQLKTWTQREGQVRLSEDNGLPSREFLEDDYDDDHEGLEFDDEDDEPLTERNKPPTQGIQDGESEEVQRLRRLW